MLEHHWSRRGRPPVLVPQAFLQQIWGVHEGEEASEKREAGGQPPSSSSSPGEGGSRAVPPLEALSAFAGRDSKTLQPVAADSLPPINSGKKKKKKTKMEEYKKNSHKALKMSLHKLLLLWGDRSQQEQVHNC